MENKERTSAYGLAFKCGLLDGPAWLQRPEHLRNNGYDLRDYLSDYFRPHRDPCHFAACRYQVVGQDPLVAAEKASLELRDPSRA